MSSSRSLEKKLFRALKEKFQGECYFDTHTRIAYSTAACIYRITPLVICMPRDGDDVKTVVQVARDFKIPVTARGAGAGLTGSALGSGIIIDFSRYMNRILSIDSDNRMVKLEPGVVQRELDDALKKYNLFFPPDPSSKAYCTIGGMIGNNAAGPHSIKYGSTRQYVRSLSCVMSSGEELLFTSAMKDQGTSSHQDILWRNVNDVLCKYQDVFAAHAPKTRKNSSGYLLDKSRNIDGSLNFPSLFSASEGTLALFTGAELAVHPRPAETGMSLLFFDSLAGASDAVVHIAQLKPSMLEIMEDTFIKLVRNSAYQVGIAFPQNLKAMLLIEFEGESESEVEDRLAEIDRLSAGFKPGLIASRRAISSVDKQTLLRVRDAASPILNRMALPLSSIRFIEDGAVPVVNLPDYIAGLHKIFANYGISGVIFGHAGDGHIHVNPLMNIESSDFASVMTGIAEDTVDLIRSLDGTLSGEHGDGRIRSPYLPRIFGPMFSAFEEIKRIFDPENVLNPGIIVNGSNEKITANLRIREYTAIKSFDHWMNQSEVREDLRRCARCGACRSYCPVFLALKDEIAAPRTKINLIHALLSGKQISDLDGIGPLEKSILDLCINCGACLTDCPSGIDVPFIIQHAKQSFQFSWGLSLSEKIMSHPDQIGKISCLAPKMVNRLRTNTRFRAFLKWLIGIDPRRRLPPTSSHPMKTDSWEGDLIETIGKRVVFFPGCFSTYNDASGEGAAILAILMHHGIFPLMPDSKCCGIAQFTAGDLQTALETARENVEILEEFAEKDYTIITGSPSCGLALKYEYPKHLQTEASRKVASQVRDIHEFLSELLRDGFLDTNFRKLTYKLAIHQPCHMRAQGTAELPEKLLRLIPGLELHALQPKCCGMAGTYGFKERTYDFSLKIGLPLFNEIKRILPDMVITSCGACRIQIEQVTGIPTLHPASIIALSYGLLEIPKGLGLHEPSPGETIPA